METSQNVEEIAPQPKAGDKVDFEVFLQLTPKSHTRSGKTGSPGFFNIVKDPVVVEAMERTGTKPVTDPTPRRETLNLCQEALKRVCKELFLLTLMYFGDKTKAFKRFRRPGIMHSVRWMIKLINTMKIVILNPQIIEARVTVCANKAQLQNLEFCTVFCAFVSAKVAPMPCCYG